MGEDRISKLPDCIIAVHILSRLPTLEAVRTCILSKRWVHIWTHITNLHFKLLHYDEVLERDHAVEDFDLGCFQNFVSMVLGRLTTPSIENFYLSASEVVSGSSFKNWCHALSKMKIKKMTISYEDDVDNDTFIISRHFFSCRSLVQLSLSIRFGRGVTVPDLVHLPMLKTLELSGIKFRPEYYGYSQEIKYSFPVLEKLKCSGIVWRNVGSVTFEVPLAETVELRKCQSSGNCPINLCTSRLTYFTFVGHPSRRYNILSKPSSDVNASIRIIFCKFDGSEEERKQWGIQACILLKQLNINHVKHLELTSTKVFSFAQESFADLPSFNMLCHLKLNEVGGEMLVELLLKSPYLTSLTIQMEHSSYQSKSEEELCEHDHTEKLLVFGIVPECIHNTLKTCKIEKFDGHHCQVSLAKYMMENAEHLELLSFSPSRVFQHNPDKKKMEEIKEKFFSYKRGLNLTIIEFSGLF